MPETTITLIPDIDSRVHQLPEVLTECMALAEKVASEARSIAPVAENPGVGLPGDYKRGIVAQQTRGGARVVAQDPKSAWVEFGIPSKNIPPQFVIRRAAEACGLAFTKSKRGS